MTTARLPISFALSLCTGAALFGLLHVMIGVRVAVAIPTVRVEFRPDVPTTIYCGRRLRAKPVLEKPKLPPEMPPITMDRSVGTTVFYAGEERAEFDASDTIDAFDASSIWPLGS